MGRRGELNSVFFLTENKEKTYFFNIKENTSGDKFLNIVESVKDKSGYRRHSIFIFQEDIGNFITSVNNFDFKRDSTVKIPSFTGRREYILALKTVKVKDKNNIIFNIVEDLVTNDFSKKKQTIKIFYEDSEMFFKKLNEIYSLWED